MTDTLQVVIIPHDPSPSLPTSPLPSRPPRSPLRTSHSRSVSALSATGLAYLRGTLHSFSKSLHPDPSHDMPLVEQRSSRRVLTEMLEQLNPVTPYVHSDRHGSLHNRKHSSPKQNMNGSPPGPTETLGGQDVQPRHLAALDLAEARDCDRPRAVHTEVLDKLAFTPTKSTVKNGSRSLRLKPAASVPKGPKLRLAIRTGTPTKHPFAAVIAMMEEQDEQSHRKGQTRSKEVLGGKPTEGFPQGAGTHGGSTEGKPRSIAIRASPSTSRRASTFLSPSGVRPATSVRPAPANPISIRPSPRFAPSSLQQTPAYRDQAERLDLPGDPTLVEIPRFKKRGLNLSIVEKQGPWRLAWSALWTWWMCHALLSLFFDINVVIILLQCVTYPSLDSSQKSWTFATAAYIICCVLSTLAVWIGWEVWYEFWRRWRLPRPAIESIYLSLPATLHLCLKSYHHFVFIVHVRLSPLGTPYSRDIIPEACHCLVQLLPGLVPLLPRAAIAIVLLTAFTGPRPPIQTPFGAIDQVHLRDAHFFRPDSPGQLTPYSTAVLYAFVTAIGVRLMVVILAAMGLWLFSRDKWAKRVSKLIWNPVARSRSKVPTLSRDPNNTTPPERPWNAAENEFEWAWRDRTRVRIQDAFELCMIRRDNSQFLHADIPWGARSRTSLAMTRATSSPPNPASTEPDSPQFMSSGDFLSRFVGDVPASLSAAASPKASRPESGVLPRQASGNTKSQQPLPPVSRGLKGIVAASDSSTDAFYTPRESSTRSTRSRHGHITEFGVRRSSGDSAHSVVDDSAGLLSSSSSRPESPAGSSSIDSHNLSSQTHDHRRPGGTGSAPPDSAGPRSRSSSISALREGLVRRARSGTLMSLSSRYSRLEDHEGAEYLSTTAMGREGDAGPSMRSEQVGPG